ADGDPSRTAENEWGRITTQQFLTPAFDNSAEARENQDVGLDGLSSERETAYFQDRFINRLNVLPDALQELTADPSADDCEYYLSPEHDQNDAKILERYQRFNGMEGNTPITSNTNLPYTPSGSNIPDNEDLTNDNTLNELESYYEYNVELKPSDMQVGRNNIVDQVVHYENGEEVKWFLFRIPIRQPDKSHG